MQTLRLPRMVLTFPRVPRSSWEARLRLIKRVRSVETEEQRAKREAAERMRDSDFAECPSWLRSKRSFWSELLRAWVGGRG
jgi:hypothetical protein